MARLVPQGLFGAAPRYLRLLRSQYWPPERLRRYAEDHLAATMAAAIAIPFYRGRFHGTPRTDDLARLPVLPRAEIPMLAESVRSLHAPAVQLLTSSRTSGSIGMPVSFFYDAAHQASRFAARARYLRENGWNPLRRSAWLVATGMQSPDSWFGLRAHLFGIRFISHLTDLDAQAAWLREQNPFYVYAYPVNLEGLAQIFEANRWRLKSLRRIFSGSEVLEDSLRERLRRVFGVPVSDNYGSTEAFLAWECPKGNYHVNAEHVVIEIVDDNGKAAAPGTMGRILVTTLHNRLMPLVRYEIGDYAIAARESCSCGRTLPTIGKILGREINLFIDGNRKRFSPWALFRPLTAREWVKQFQIGQRDIGRFVVRFVSERPLAAADEAEIRAHFETILRFPATVAFERMPQLPRAPSGKFMMALNECPESGR